jgi:hypothetical protein
MYLIASYTQINDTSLNSLAKDESKFKLHLESVDHLMRIF